jgi:hypothetical protein
MEDVRMMEGEASLPCLPIGEVVGNRASFPCLLVTVLRCVGCMLVWRCVVFGTSIELRTAKSGADRGEGLFGGSCDELIWGLYKGEWCGVLLHSLIPDCVYFCANSNGSNPRHFVGKAIRSGEGKGIRANDGRVQGRKGLAG